VRARNLFSLLETVHEKRIEIRWRDVDGYGHVNNAAYLTYLEEGRDAWLASVLGSLEAIYAYVIVHIEIDFRRELRHGDREVVVRCRLDRLGSSSVRTREEVLTRDGELAAEAAVVLVARELGEGSSRPLTETERSAFGRAAATERS
jgi:acyl-CoA thioester hydrolase